MLRFAIPLVLLPFAANALTLDLPGRPKVTTEVVGEAQTMILPTAPWVDNVRPSTLMTGLIVKRALTTPDKINITATTQKLTDQLKENGYQISLQCNQSTCGGFDFTFGQDMIAPPAMFIDFGNYTFVSATKGGTKGVTLLVSRNSTATYFHVATVNENATLTNAPAVVAAGAVLSVPDSLDQIGKVVLDDLAFKSGSSELEGTDFPSLMELADYLSANPEVAIALVGHTDAKGGLDANTALSRNRAEAVRTVLVNQLGVQASRVVAQGIGYLSPRASNATDDGRARNRRVEAVITTTP